MPHPLSHTILKISLVAATFALLVACSANRLAYNNLVWLIGWKVDDYVSLDREQKKWLRSRTRQHLDWHCSSELERYKPLLSDLQSTLYNDSLDTQMLMAGQPRVEAAVDRLFQEIAPTAAGLLSQLNDDQVMELKASLRKKHTELEEKYIEPDLTTQYNDRIERAEERFVDWLGPLEDRQQARLNLWAATLQGHNQIWLSNREAWQHAFLTALESRTEDSFEERILSLLIDRERYWTPDFKAISEVNRKQGTDLVVDMINMASEKQKERLDRRFNGLQEDIGALQCAPT